MAKRRTISYRTTAMMALGGGLISAAAAIVDLWARTTEADLGSLSTALGIVGITAWFLGTAAGILALSTEYKRTAIVGLGFCGFAILLFMLSPMLTG